LDIFKVIFRIRLTDIKLLHRYMEAYQSLLYTPDEQRQASAFSDASLSDANYGTIRFRLFLNPLCYPTSTCLRHRH
jgi:hypothetical protein